MARYDGIVESVKDDDVLYPHSSQKYQLGAKLFKDGDQYVYVYNDGGSNIGTGQYCVLAGIANSLTSGYSVTVTNASLTNYMVGVAQNTFTTATYGFVMTRGTSYVTPDSGAISCNVGVDLVLGTDGGFRPLVDSMTTTNRIFGYTMNSFITAAGSGRARIFGSII